MQDTFPADFGRNYIAAHSGSPKSESPRSESPARQSSINSDYVPAKDNHIQFEERPDAGIDNQMFTLRQ